MDNLLKDEDMRSARIRELGLSHVTFPDGFIVGYIVKDNTGSWWAHEYEPRWHEDDGRWISDNNGYEIGKDDSDNFVSIPEFCKKLAPYDSLFRIVD